MEKLMALGLMVLVWIESTFNPQHWSEWWRDEEGPGFSVQDFWFCVGILIVVWIIMQMGAWVFG